MTHDPAPLEENTTTPATWERGESRDAIRARVARIAPIPFPLTDDQIERLRVILGGAR